MKLSKTKLKKEHKLMQEFLFKQETQRNKMLCRCKHLVKGWKFCWDWDGETFFDDCLNNVDNLIYDFENHEITIE